MTQRSVFILIALLYSSTPLRAATGTTHGENPRKNAFKEYIEKMHLDLDPTEKESEYMYRLSVFSSNMDLIEEFNSRSDKREGTATLGITRFSHWTQQEFTDFVKQGAPPPTTQKPAKVKGVKVPIHKGPALKVSSSSTSTLSSMSTSISYPPELDWVQKGAVTPVKNQLMCGDCWSFSATGSLEGAYFVKYGELPGNVDFETGFYGLSEQQLTACDMLSFGCNAGYTESGWLYALENGGLVGEGDYPFILGDFHGGVIGTGNQTCDAYRNSHGNNPKVAPDPDRPFTTLNPTVDSFMDAIQLQPISIQIEASSHMFQFYTGGVISNIQSYGWFGMPNYFSKPRQCGVNLDHAVLLVGYGTFEPEHGPKVGSSIDYWKVKNSWGELWGEDGYVRIERSADNTCGLLLGGQYPNLNSNDNFEPPNPQPTFPGGEIRTLRETLDEKEAYFLDATAKTPEQVTPVSVSISGSMVDGDVDNAVICPSESFIQSHQIMIWIVGFVQNGNTFAIYLAFQNDGEYPVGASSFWPFKVPGYDIETSCEALNQYSTTSLTPNNLTVLLTPEDIQITELQYFVHKNRYYKNDAVSDDDMYTFGRPFVVQEQSASGVVVALLCICVIMYCMVQYAKLSTPRVGSRSDQYVTVEMNDNELDRGRRALSHMSVSYQYTQDVDI